MYKRTYRPSVNSNEKSILEDALEVYIERLREMHADYAKADVYAQCSRISNRIAQTTLLLEYIEQL